MPAMPYAHPHCTPPFTPGNVFTLPERKSPCCRRLLPSPCHRPVDLLELRGAEMKEEGEEGDDKRPKGEKFPYSHEVPPARRDWREEGKITPVKDQ